MEADGQSWAGESVSGPGPGGGGMIRELCRGFGRYRRYLGRLRQNLRETQKFFRDIKCSHSHSCPSSPAGGGAAELGPAGDVAEAPLPAGKDRPEGEENWRVASPSAKQPQEEAASGRGPRGDAGPGPRGSEMRWEDTLGERWQGLETGRIRKG